MKSSVKLFLEKKIKKISKKNILSNKLKTGGDIDILDSDHKIRNNFLRFNLVVNSILHLRHHKTGVRYDFLDKSGKLISIDFLNGKEKNPLYFNLSKINGKKINSNQITITLLDLPLVIYNLINYFFWRVKFLFRQSPTIIEIFGVDGSGKSYLSKKIYKRLKKISNIFEIHLWVFRKKKSLKNFPYKKKSYSLPLSLLKEFYILVRIFFLISKIFIFFNRKNIYVFDRSLYDVVIDPSRYRLIHKPKLIKIIYNFFFKKSFKIFLKVPYNLTKKRKNEMSKAKYSYISNELEYLFRYKFKNSKNFFKKI